MKPRPINLSYFMRPSPRPITITVIPRPRPRPKVVSWPRWSRDLHIPVTSFSKEWTAWLIMCHHWKNKQG